MKIVNGGIKIGLRSTFIEQLTATKFREAQSKVDPWGGDSFEYFVRYCRLSDGTYGLNFRHKTRLNWESHIWIVPLKF